MSGVVTIAQAAPSLTPQQSKRPERVRDDRRVEDRVEVDFLLQMRLGILRAVLMTLPGDAADRALEVVLRYAVLGAIARGELRKARRRRAVRHDQVVERSLGLHRQSAVAGVLELLGADGERDVDRAGRHGVGRPSQCLGAGRAHVLDARHRDALETQRSRRRDRGIADVDPVERGAVPGRADLALLDARVVQAPPGKPRTADAPSRSPSARRTSSNPCR